MKSSIKNAAFSFDIWDNNMVKDSGYNGKSKRLNRPKKEDKHEIKELQVKGINC